MILSAMPRSTRWWSDGFKIGVLIGCLTGSGWTKSNHTPAINWQVQSYADIAIFYTAPDSPQVARVRQIISETLTVLRPFFQFTQLQASQIFICPTPDIFRAFSGANVPEWSEALCLCRQNTILLKSPQWSSSRRLFKAVVVHELVHLILAQTVGPHPIPTWFTEGLAVYFSGERDLATSTLIAKASFTRSLIPLNDIDYVLKFRHDKAALAYQESFWVVKFLIEDFGSASISRIINGLKTGQSIDAIFRTEFRLEFAEFETSWREQIYQQKRWDVILDFDTLLWPLLTVLFLLAALTIYIRNRRRLRQWAEEDDATEVLPPPLAEDEMANDQLTDQTGEAVQKSD